MNKRERVLAALRGEPVDAIPVGFWGHHFLREGTARDLADETVEKALRYDWDFVKIQPRAICFSQVWGAEWLPAAGPTTRPAQARPLVTSVQDLERLIDAPVDRAPLDQQLEAIRLIRAGLPDGRPILMTAFSPLMVTSYFFAGAPDQPARRAALAMLREDPRRADRLLSRIEGTIKWFMRASLDAGADGIFYATNMASAAYATADDVDRFERPYTTRLLAAIAHAPFNIFHICDTHVFFDRLADIPATSLNWASGNGNPSLRDVRDRYGRAVLGGITSGPALAGMTPDAVAAEARAAIAETGGRGLLLAGKCAIRRDTPAENLDAVARVARSVSA